MFTPEIIRLRDYLVPNLKGRTISDARHELSLTEHSNDVPCRRYPGDSQTALCFTGTYRDSCCQRLR